MKLPVFLVRACRASQGLVAALLVSAVAACGGQSTAGSDSIGNGDSGVDGGTSSPDGPGTTTSSGRTSNRGSPGASSGGASSTSADMTATGGSASTGGGSSSTDPCSSAPGYATMTVFDKCTGCHSSTLSRFQRLGAPSYVNFDTYDAAVASASRAVSQVQSGRMPPRGTAPLTADEKNELFTWVDCGTPR